MEDDSDAIKKIFAEARVPAVPDVSDQARVRLTGISSRAWEHPADRAALTALRKVPGFDQMLRTLFGWIPERSLRLLYLGNAVRVGGGQFQRIDRLFDECCAILDAERRPELFVAGPRELNAGAIGWDRPLIVLNSGAIELLDDDELRFVLAHELAHVVSGHVLYKTMVRIALSVVLFRFGFGVPLLVLRGLLIALLEWDRKSELSADRAGLLCVQDPRVAFRVHMKTAGGSHIDQMNVDAFMKQAEDYERSGDAIDSLLKLRALLNRRHPFPVLRIAELKRWVDAGDYARILGGDYPRRGEDDDASLRDDLKRSADAYKESWTGSGDPMARFVSDLGSTVGDMGNSVFDQVREFFRRGPSEGDGGKRPDGAGDDA
ncbi:MAG: M48 family metallopeptidase [Myxococcales bacterium]|nr:M48 family metallopeptidase [Myxococcales bacterium]